MRVVRILSILVVVAAVVFVALSWAVPRGVSSAIDAATKESVGVGSRVEDVDVHWGSGGLSLKGLELDAPTGFEGDYALSVSDIAVHIDVTTAMARVMVVDSVVVRGAKLVLEQRATQLSTRQLVEHVRRYVASSEGADGKLFRVRYFRFEGGTATVKTDIGDAGSFDMPDLVLRDLGSNEGAPLATVVANVLEPILERTTLNTDRLPDALGRARDRFGF